MREDILTELGHEAVLKLHAAKAVDESSSKSPKDIGMHHRPLWQLREIGLVERYVVDSASAVRFYLTDQGRATAEAAIDYREMCAREEHGHDRTV